MNTQTQTDAGETASSHVVRPFREGDRRGFLDLYEAVWGRSRDAAWFDWRFDPDRWGGDWPIVVAEADDRIVGAEPCVPYRVRSGDRTLRALQPADWIVHPDYRGRGIFTEMTERWVEDPGDADLFFNFPFPSITSGLEAAGWSIAGPVRTFYRIERPADLAAARDVTRWCRALARALAPAARGYLSVRRRRASTAEDVSVTVHEGVATDALLACHRLSPPRRIHVRRDRRYYAWRFANPRWSTTTYVARRDGDPVAALLACRRSLPDVEKVTLLEAQPMASGGASTEGENARDDRSVSRDGLLACVRAACRDHDDATLFDAAGEAIPPSVLRAAGFLPDDAAPLSWWKSGALLATRPASDDLAVADHCSLDAREDWLLPLADRDVA